VTSLNPYLAFTDNARAAMTFYADALGGELTISTFGEFGHADGPSADKVMHAMLTTPAGLTLMASDTPPGMERAPLGGFAISLSGDDETELRGYWDKLSDGATVDVPLERQMWGDVFGQLTDRFGVSWMVNIASGTSGQE
jgi:PhnB protein